MGKRQIMSDKIKSHASGCILTYSGEMMDPLHPDPERIHIEDIAHSLSMLCRANGHFKTFHSVAGHCIECYEEAKARNLPERVQAFCLLHDAAEAYLGDFVSPVKYRMDDYREAEETILSCVYRKYIGSLPSREEEDMVKEIDRTLLYYEFEALMGQPVGDEPACGLVSDQDFRERDRRDVEREYLQLFNKITGDNCLSDGDERELSASVHDGRKTCAPGKEGRETGDKGICVFFDVDETLYDQSEVFCRIYHDMFGALSDVPAKEIFLRSSYYNELVFDKIQSGRMHPSEVIPYRLQMAMRDYNIPVKEAEAGRFRDRYIEAEGEISLSAEMEGLLCELADRCVTGVITNGVHDHQSRKIESLGLKRLIPEELVLISGDVGFRKPEAGIFREAERRCKGTASRMIYVGDNYENDVAGAMGAGWTAVWMNRKRLALPAGARMPDYEVHTEKELRVLLEDILQKSIADK